jgi:hypothetical protein
MADLRLSTATGDVLVVEGEVSLSEGIESIRQHLEIRLRSFRGEWFLDERIGVSYFTDVFKKNPDITVLNAVFTKVILDTPGVISLNSLTFNLESDRRLLVEFRATTEAGVLDYSGFVGV